MGDHVAEPTQVRYPWKATLRTAIAFILPLAAGAPLIYQAAFAHDPAAATGIGASILAIAAGITRLMALPVVNDALTKIGLGSTPK